MRTCPPIWTSVEQFDIGQIPRDRLAQVWPRDIRNVPVLLITNAQGQRKIESNDILRWLQIQIASITQQNGGQAPPSVPAASAPQIPPGPVPTAPQQQQAPNFELAGDYRTTEAALRQWQNQGGHTCYDPATMSGFSEQFVTCDQLGRDLQNMSSIKTNFVTPEQMMQPVHVPQQQEPRAMPSNGSGGSRSSRDDARVEQEWQHRMSQIAEERARSVPAPISRT